MLAQAFYLTPEGSLQTGLDEAAIHAAFQSGQGLLWVDVSETTDEDGAFLARVFGFHHLTIEDCVNPLIHPPKIDEFDDYIFFIVHGINHAAESDIVETAELEMFLGPHYVVTNHNFPILSLSAVAHETEREDGRPMRRGADFLAHRIIDTLIDNILPTIERMDEVANEVEEEAIRSPHQVTIDTLLKLKRSIQRINRVIAPQREIINRLSRGDFPLIGEEARIYYRDVYDHLYRIDSLNQILRDRAGDALSTYLSSIAVRQNETMKVLGMVATVFLPLTLVAGIYGMNFDYMPELRWRWGYYAVVGFMAAVIIVSFSLFWARQWMAWWRRQARRVRPFAVEPERLLHYVGNLTRGLRL
jgi:magnesium transporter